MGQIFGKCKKRKGGRHTEESRECAKRFEKYTNAIKKVKKAEDEMEPTDCFSCPRFTKKGYIYLLFRNFYFFFGVFLSIFLSFSFLFDIFIIFQFFFEIFIQFIYFLNFLIYSQNILYFYIVLCFRIFIPLSI